MLKRIGRQAYQLLLASLLVGAIFASFQGSATFAQILPEEPVLIGDGGALAAVAVAANSVRTAPSAAILVVIPSRLSIQRSSAPDTF